MIAITVTGNLGRQAENRVTKTGKEVAEFSIGSTPRIKTNGEWVDGETLWFTITYWGYLPENLFDKGTTVIVTGDLQKRTYEKDGVTKERLHITATNIGIVHKSNRNPMDSWQPIAEITPNPALLDDLPF